MEAKQKITDGNTESGIVQREEDIGVLGQVAERRPNEVMSPEEERRKEMYALMAANMIIEDEPRGNYFVSNPGL